MLPQLTLKQKNVNESLQKEHEPTSNLITYEKYFFNLTLDI